MDMSTFTVPVPGWAQKELEHVHRHVRETLPATLRPLWDTNGFGLTGFDRKPLRPYLVLLVARHYGCSGPRPLRLGASIQMTHVASMLHDRLGYTRKASGAAQDAAPEAHQREALDILLGDFFFSKASSLIVEDGETRIIQEHIRTSLESAENQAAIVRLDPDVEEIEPARCFEVVADKVSSLLALSLRVGAILGKAPREEEEALSDCGFLMGRVVRILEDLAIWEHFSRGTLSPGPETRFSHPLILVWEERGRAAWKEAVGRLEASDREEWKALRARLDGQGYLAASRRTAFGFAEQALEKLEGLGETEEVRLLKGVVRFHFLPAEEQGQEISP
jgi:octaprenyl-diphosphate synthase